MQLHAYSSDFAHWNTLAANFGHIGVSKAGGGLHIGLATVADRGKKPADHRVTKK